MKRAKKCLSPMPMDIRWCNDVPLGRCQGSNDRRKRIKKAI